MGFEAQQAHQLRDCLQGNWGNALLAYGSLKKKVLTAVSSTASDSVDQAAVAATQAKITQEASDALIAAGKTTPQCCTPFQFNQILTVKEEPQ